MNKLFELLRLQGRKLTPLAAAVGLTTLMVFSIPTAMLLGASTGPTTQATEANLIDAALPVPTIPGTAEPRMVSLCHRTGSDTQPYKELRVNERAVESHLRHGDIYPVPPGGCPGAGTPETTRTVVATRTITATRTVVGAGTPGLTRTATAGTPQVTRTITGTRTPGVTGTPQATRTVTITRTANVTRTPGATRTVQLTRTAPPSRTSTVGRTNTPRATRTLEPTGEGKVSICHRTGSDNNPYVEIRVSRNALDAHLAHGDIYPVPPGGCPRERTPQPTRTTVATGTTVATRTPHATITRQATETRHRTSTVTTTATRHATLTVGATNTVAVTATGTSQATRTSTAQATGTGTAHATRTSTVLPPTRTGTVQAAGTSTAHATRTGTAQAMRTSTAGVTVTAAIRMMTICHATGSERNRYVEISVTEAEAEQHRLNHENDMVPAPPAGCPRS